MAKYPVKVMLDHQRRPFFPFITPDVIVVNDSDMTLMELIDDRYTKEEVDEIIRSLGTLQRICGTVASVSDLPESAENGDTYIVLDASGNNSEYMWINNEWEELGPFVDLSNYYTKSDTDTAIANKAADVTLAYEQADSTNLQAAKDYTDLQISNIPQPDLSNYYTKSETYTKTEIDNKDTSTLNTAKGYTDAQIAAIPVTDLLHYKGHVADVSGLPSTGQPSGTADPRDCVGINLNQSKYSSYFNFKTTTDTTNAKTILENAHSGIISQYTYYIVDYYNGYNYQIFAFNNPDDVKIELFPNQDYYGNKTYSFILQLNASASHPVYHYYHSGGGGSAWRTPCKKYLNSGASTNLFDINTVYNEPVLVGSFNDWTGSGYGFYTNANIKYISDINQALTNVSLSDINTAFGAYYRYPGYSLKFTANNNYIFSNNMIFIKATDLTTGALNLQFDETTTKLNDTYTVGSNYEIYRRNESVSWDVFSKNPTTLAELADDSTHRLVTDTDTTAWNAKLGTSDIATTISSASTNNEVASALAVYNYINGLNGNGVSY